MSYSVFARIKDLSQHNLDSIQALAHSMDMCVVDKGLYQTIQWSDNHTAITI